MMRSWLKGRDGSGDGAGAPAEFRQALDEVLRPLREEARLARDLRDFVLTGTPASALTEASGHQRLPQVLSLWGPPMASASLEVHRRFYTAFNDVDAEVAVRWARLLESLVPNGHPVFLMRPLAGAGWAEALLLHLSNVFSAARSRGGPADSVAVRHETIERMLAAAGDQPSALLVEGFRLPTRPGYVSGRGRTALRMMAGYDEAVRRHATVLRPIVVTPKADARLQALEMLAPTSPETLRLFGAELTELATSTSSQVRAAAAPLLDQCGDAAVEPLRRTAEQGKPEARLHALRLLWSMKDPALRDWARERAKTDRAASVRALVGEWESALAAEQSPCHDLGTPPTPEIDWSVPVTHELRGLLDRMAEEIRQAIDKANATYRAHARKWEEANPGRKASWFSAIKPLPDSWPAEVARELQAGRPPRATDGGAPARVPAHLAATIVESHAAHPALGPVGLTILLNNLGLVLDHSGRLSDVASVSYNAVHETAGVPTLLEISTMLDAMGVDGGRAVFFRYGAKYGDVLAQDWPDADVAPFVATHLDLVLEGLASATDDYYYRYALVAAAQYRALATLPTLPRHVADTLFTLALGNRKTDRRPAQDALARVPGFEERVVTALSDGKGEMRTVAAQWLGRLRHEPALPALEAAVAREKQDVAKGAMLDALEALGQPVEKYLDRETLTKQAATAVARGLPKELGWMRWEGLPTVRWADSGDAVPLEVLQWFAAQAVRAKSAEPNAVLRKYCAMFDPGDREELGQLLLEAWVAEDLRPIDPDEAQRRADERAEWTHRMITHWGHTDHPLYGASVEQIAATYLPECLRDPVGSATASKGVLAVAAACAGERATPVAARYLKEWYGLRAAQGKALISMLAWVEHPSATQLMLSVGSRFRTKSIQEEATRQAEALAERKGWSVDELADRTIPTAGLDETGTLELSYGDRVFTGVLQPDLTIVLHSPEGKKITALPNPRQSDDEARAKASKKALTTARKELKAVVKLQTERLYEALCTQRTWVFDDWQRYLNAHPVMRHLTQRLAWVAVTPEGAQVFRPLDDGTLTDVDDEETTVPPDAVVAVAHDTNLDDATVRAWQQHFDDYEVAPLFQQFGKGIFKLSEGKASAREDTDFRGYLVEAFKLRGRATKLGYTRGSTEDGGWFFCYEKRFPTLGLSAVIEFSGNPLPEQNRTVALTGLRFVRHGANGSGGALRLGDVPVVLLSEAYGDIRLVAADGPGHDPEWEKKVEF